MTNTIWPRIQQVFADADTIDKLTRLYHERGDVTWDEAREWALAKWREGQANEPPGKVP